MRASWLRWGQLASSVAHEVSQPAASLTLLIDEAEEHLQAQRWDEMQICLAESKAQVRRLSRLLTRLKQLSRDDPVQIQDLLLPSVVDEALRLCRPALVAAGITVCSAVPALRVRADSERVILSLVNLINNAVDAMRGQTEPAPQLEVAAEPADGPPHEVCLSVTDNGPGFSPQDRQQVLKSFYTTKANGLGLGLTITREALSSMGARLEIAHAAERGARFSIYLPV